MPRDEFIQGVGGSDGPGIETNESGSIETNNYTSATTLSEDGSAYPYSLAPSWDIQGLWFRNVAEGIEADVTFIDGSTDTWTFKGGSGFIGWWSIESIDFRDPSGTAASIEVTAGGDTA